MKIVTIVAMTALTLVSAFAHAEEYLNCKISGQSDSVVSAPRKVYLSESRKWTLLENGKKVRNIIVKVSRQGINVKHTKIESGGQVMEYSYDFDDSKCDSHQVGEAVLTKRVVGATDSGTPTAPVSSSTTIYSCTCAVD